MSMALDVAVAADPRAGATGFQQWSKTIEPGDQAEPGLVRR